MMKNGTFKQTGFHFSSRDKDGSPIEPHGPHLLTWMFFHGVWYLIDMRKEKIV